MYAVAVQTHGLQHVVVGMVRRRGGEVVVVGGWVMGDGWLVGWLVGWVGGLVVWWFGGLVVGWFGGVVVWCVVCWWWCGACALRKCESVHDDDIKIHVSMKEDVPPSRQHTGTTTTESGSAIFAVMPPTWFSKLSLDHQVPDVRLCITQ